MNCKEKQILVKSRAQVEQLNSLFTSLLWTFGRNFFFFFRIINGFYVRISFPFFLFIFLFDFLLWFIICMKICLKHDFQFTSYSNRTKWKETVFSIGWRHYNVSSVSLSNWLWNLSVMFERYCVLRWEVIVHKA